MMFSYFNMSKQPIKIQGKKGEYIVLTRQNNSSSSNFKFNYVFKGLLQEDSALENGDVFTDSHGVKHMVVACRRTLVCYQCTVYRQNADIMIQRLVKEYAGNVVKGTRVVDIGKMPTLHTTINGTMRLLDSGLLPTTTKQFIVPKCDIRLLDRILLDGVRYQVDMIDETKFAGVYAVQVSIDKRS